MKNNQRRKRYIGTSLQKKILFLIFASVFVPVVLVTAALYYLIFDMLGYQMVFPEAIISNIFPVLDRVNFFIIIALPVCIIIIWFLALELSNRIAGPVYRLEKELDARINHEKSGPIKLRKGDELWPLTEKINKLMCK